MTIARFMSAVPQTRSPTYLKAAPTEVAHVTPKIADDRGERGQLHRS